MEKNSVNINRIAKNTIFLYTRMLITVVVSLYASRLLFKELGEIDYGIYTFVAGIVVVLSFINISMTGATQRFLNYESGIGDYERLKLVFSTALSLHILIALIIFVLSEIIGVWYLNTYAKIDESRLYAANFVFQFSTLSLVFSVLSVPYNAIIIAKEKMSFMAYISIIEAILKFIIVYLLYKFSEKLIIYSALLSLVSFLILLMYIFFSTYNFSETRVFKIKYDKVLMINMFKFSGWTMFGSLGTLSHTQGISIILNHFFGVVLNAAQGISNQVTNLVNQFVNNFMLALNPQIVKCYTTNQMNEVRHLVNKGCRMGIILVSMFSIPLIVETPTILMIWLGKEIPEYTIIFIRIMLLASICNSYAYPLSTVRGATGNIKRYQIVLTFIGLLHIPLTYLLFKYGFKPYYSMIIYLVIVNIQQLYRILNISKIIDLRVGDILYTVCLKGFLMVSISFSLSFLLSRYLSDSLVNSLIIILCSVFFVLITSYFIVISSNERLKIITILRNKFYKIS